MNSLLHNHKHTLQKHANGETNEQHKNRERVKICIQIIATCISVTVMKINIVTVFAKTNQ